MLVTLGKRMEQSWLQLIVDLWMKLMLVADHKRVMICLLPNRNFTQKYVFESDVQYLLKLISVREVSLRPNFSVLKSFPSYIFDGSS